MLISADSLEELNAKVNDALAQGMFLWGSPFIVPNSYHNSTRFFQQVSNINQAAGGSNGKSAYQIWTEQPGNESKTVQEFLESLEGTDGTNGKSAYQIWLEQPGNAGKTEQQFLVSLIGQPGTNGTNGTNGVNGKSAYEVWLDLPGNAGKSVSEFIGSLMGTPGTNGTNGVNGKSAYEVWLDLPGNAGKTVQQFITAITGAPGANGLDAYALWLTQPGNAGKPITDFFAATAGTRKKSEVYWTGLNLVVPEDTPTNLINLLKAIVPTTGTLEPFFKITDNKMHPFNEDSTVTFKLNLKGTFTGGLTTARSVTLDFVGTQGNTLLLNRSQATTNSTLSFVTFFSVDKNGNLATNGTAITIFASGSTFTINEALLVAEQRTTQ
ncbi:MAG: tail needle knob protein [Bacteroidales bacterium]